MRLRIGGGGGFQGKGKQNSKKEIINQIIGKKRGGPLSCTHRSVGRVDNTVAGSGHLGRHSDISSANHSSLLKPKRTKHDSYTNVSIFLSLSQCCRL